MLAYYGRHERLLNKALLIASTSTERMQHGVIIARGSRVLAVGVNRARNSPLVCTDPPAEAGRHAEWAAIHALPHDTDFSKLTLYSARLGRRGDARLAKPCRRCEALIATCGFKNVIWT